MPLKMTSAPVAAFLTLCLASCTARMPPPPAPIILLPPESTFRLCERPTLQGNTWGDIGSYALALQTALSICAGQVVTLNQWRAGIKGEM
ncbi:Rz1-like lysis system protein LysC [Serratia marcescens]|uniref:Rz1-like lysis system protein LysC n=1 Tax=Serratia marcescens TaxID=615 RepID=UPI00402B8CF6